MKFDTLIEGFQNVNTRMLALSQVITELFPFSIFAIVSLSEAYF